MPRGSLRLSLPMLGRARAWECGWGMTSSCCFWAFMAVYALTTLPNATTWQTGHDLFLIQSFHQHSDLLGHWLHLERHIVEGKGLNFGASPENLPFVLVAFHSLQEESSSRRSGSNTGLRRHWQLVPNSIWPSSRPGVGPEKSTTCLSWKNSVAEFSAPTTIPATNSQSWESKPKVIFLHDCLHVLEGTSAFPAVTAAGASTGIGP